VYASWNDARTYVRSLGLAGQKDWLDWRSTVRETWCIPIKIPRVPEDVYRSEWQGLRDWLGLDEVFCFLRHRPTHEYHEAGGCSGAVVVVVSSVSRRGGWCNNDWTKWG
jgi:hypothetical protein